MPHSLHLDLGLSAKFMAPVRQTILVIEVIPGSTTCPEILLADLNESARHVRQFVPEGGLEWQFGA